MASREYSCILRNTACHDIIIFWTRVSFVYGDWTKVSKRTLQEWLLQSHHHADRDEISSQLGPLHLSSHSPPIFIFFFLWQNHFSARFISPITPAHSSRRRGERLFCLRFQLLCQIPPGATRIPVIASSKLRYACTLTHMKRESEGEAVSQRERLNIWLRVTRRSVGSLLAVRFQFAWFKLSHLKLQMTT